MQIEWYFDYLSPFSYLQLELLQRNDWIHKIQMKPVLLAGLLNHWGQKGPAEISSKRIFTYKFIQWKAHQLQIPLQFPAVHPFNPLSLLRFTLSLGSNAEVVSTIFKMIWQEGRTFDSSSSDEIQEDWSLLLERLGVSNFSFAFPENIKKQLLLNGEEAVAKGIFGVPSIAVGTEIFWGVDAFEMFEDFIKNPAFFSSPEMKRMESIKVGVRREGR